MHVGEKKKTLKTYNSGYSLVVTHLTTNPPVRCLNRAERTGSLVFNVLWSYVEIMLKFDIHNPVIRAFVVLTNTIVKQAIIFIRYSAIFFCNRNTSLNIHTMISYAFLPKL